MTNRIVLSITILLSSTLLGNTTSTGLPSKKELGSINMRGYIANWYTDPNSCPTNLLKTLSKQKIPKKDKYLIYQIAHKFSEGVNEEVLTLLVREYNKSQDSTIKWQLRTLLGEISTREGKESIAEIYKMDKLGQDRDHSLFFSTIRTMSIEDNKNLLEAMLNYMSKWKLSTFNLKAYEPIVNTKHTDVMFMILKLESKYLDSLDTFLIALEHANNLGEEKSREIIDIILRIKQRVNEDKTNDGVKALIESRLSKFLQFSPEGEGPKIGFGKGSLGGGGDLERWDKQFNHYMSKWRATLTDPEYIEYVENKNRRNSITMQIGIAKANFSAENEEEIEGEREVELNEIRPYLFETRIQYEDFPAYIEDLKMLEELSGYEIISLGTYDSPDNEFNGDPVNWGKVIERVKTDNTGQSSSEEP